MSNFFHLSGFLHKQYLLSNYKFYIAIPYFIKHLVIYILMSKYKNSLSLYYLIQKMTGSEKRYFKIHSQSHVIGNENLYVLLFDIITEYVNDKKTIKEQEIKEAFLTLSGKKRFDLYKQNLYQKLLLALEGFHRANSPEIKIRSLVSQANILFLKGLGDQALHLIAKAKKYCNEYEKWYILLELLELERHITYAIQRPQLDNSKELYIIDKVSEVGSLRNLQSQVWKTYMTHGLPTNEEILAHYSELANNPILHSDTEPRSLEAKMIYLYCHQFLAGMKGNIERTYRKGFELIQLMDKNPGYMSDKGELYIRSLINLQYPMVRLGKYVELKEIGRKCREKLGQFGLSPAFVTSITISTFINEYDVAFKCNLMHELGPIIQNMDNYVVENEKSLNPPTLHLYHWQRAIHDFVQEDYSSTWDWISRIENSPSIYRQDIQAYSKIMNLILHFEAENYRLLHHATLNTYRFLRKKGRLDQVEQLLLNLIKKGLITDQSKSARKAFFKGIYSDIQHVKRDEVSHEATVLMYFEKYISNKAG